MIKHIVLFTFKDEDGLSALQNAQKAGDMLLALTQTVPTLRSLEVGLNEKPSDTASDLVLISEFDTYEGLTAYLAHPEHKKVAEFIGKVKIERRVIDYTF